MKSRTWVGFHGLFSRLDVEVRLVFLIGKTRKVQDASRIGGYIDVRPVGVFVAQPGPKLEARGFPSAGNALDGFAEVAVQHEHGDPVGLLEVV